MRVIFTIIFIIFFEDIKGQTFNLNINFESSLNLKIIDRATLVSNNLSSEKPWAYNQVENCVQYHWNNVPPGDYRFIIHTVFNIDRILKFRVKANTSFFVKIDSLFENVNIISLEDFKSKDTIRIYYQTVGCFLEFNQYTEITRNYTNNTYHLLAESNNGADDDWYIDIDKEFSIDLIEKLYKLQLDSRKLRVTGHDGKFVRSTQKNYLMILSGNKLFQFDDLDLGDYEYYFNLMETLRGK